MRRKLLSWGRDNYINFPWRDEKNQFHALVAEILLQRTRAEQVANIYDCFKARFPDPYSLATADISDIESAILPLGLKWRSRYLKEMGKKLYELGQRIPNNLELLKTLPGIGPYAAAAYISFHTNIRASIIDSNVVRLYGRFFGFETNSETRRDKKLIKLTEIVTPINNYRDFNYAVLDFSHSICKIKPVHSLCLIARKCRTS